MYAIYGILCYKRFEAEKLHCAVYCLLKFVVFLHLPNHIIFHFICFVALTLLVVFCCINEISVAFVQYII